MTYSFVIDTKLDNTNYVGVENLLQNKSGKTIASSLPKSKKTNGFSKGNILIGNIRPYLRKIWLADVDGGTNGDVLAIQIDNTEAIAPRYLYYVLASESFFIYSTKHSQGTKMPRGNKGKVMEYLIPLPPLPIQEEVVRILDRFDALSNSLSMGLPAEIALRQKQFKTYRDKLLSFSPC